MANFSDLGYVWNSTLPFEADLFVGSYLSLCLILSVVTNSWVIVSLATSPSFQQLDSFIIFLLSHDLLQSLTGFVLVITASFLHGWYAGPQWCQYQGFVVYFCGTVSVWTLTILSVFRCLYTIWGKILGIYFRQWSLKMVVRLSFVGIYANALFWAALPILGFRGYVVGVSHLTCDLNWDTCPRLYVWATIVVNFVIPFSLMVVSYSTMGVHFYRISSVLRVQVTRACPVKLEMYFCKMAFLMCATFILAWGPYTVVAIYIISGCVSLVPLPILVASPLFAKTSTWVNSIVYFVAVKRMHPARAINPCSCCALLGNTMANKHGAAEEVTHRMLSPVSDGDQASRNRADIQLEAILETDL